MKTIIRFDGRITIPLLEGLGKIIHSNAMSPASLTVGNASIAEGNVITFSNVEIVFAEDDAKKHEKLQTILSLFLQDR